MDLQFVDTMIRAMFTRFSCDKEWEVQQDGLYESVDDALRQLPDQYRLIEANWMTK